MKTFRHILLYLHAALILGIATACHDDLASPTPDHEPKIGTGIVLKIPNMNKAARFASRATGDADLTTNEGVVNNDDLWLLIYSADGVTDKTHNFAIQLPMVDELTTEYKGDGPYQIENGGETYTYVPMYPGNYRAYVVANLSEYAQFPEGNETVDFEEITEAKLKTLVHNFEGVYNNAANETRKVLRPGHLPMVCLPTNVVGADDDGNFDILDKNISELKCDLEFLCSKVRYTILFDNSGTEKDNMDGFSQGAFGKDHFIDFIDATIAKVGNLTPILKDSYTLSYMTGSHGIPLDAVEYPKRTDEQEKHYFHNGECTPDTDTGKTNLEDFKTTNLPKHEEDYEDSDTQRAWQGVIYIPENLETADDSRTVITFNGEVTGFGDNAVPYSYTFPLIKGKSSGTETSSNLRRGKFYDVTLQVTGLKTMEIGFDVTLWDPIHLFYELQGPVYLNIDKTKITVQAGKASYIEYDSNVDLSFYSPTWKDDAGNEVLINGEPVEFYSINTVNEDGINRIVVRVNSAIPFSELQKLTGDQYKFFHIKAGNINKKIVVDPLELRPFLTLDEDIEINARSEIASSHYDGKVSFTVYTNCEKFKFDPVDWNILFGDDSTMTNTSDLIWLEDDKGNKVEFGAWITPSNGKATFYLCYDQLNEGKAFWTDGTEELFLVATANEATAETGNVKIKTIPSSDNYTIHMKCNWTDADPHIYVYQCLEIPGWFSKNNYAYANAPVGYRIGKDGESKNAALEFSFTGKVSFLGWDSQYNKKALDDCGFNSSDFDTGFWMLPNGGSGSWEPISDNGSHYNLNYDFAASYRSTLTCGECKKTSQGGWDGDGNYNNNGYWRTWPGIQMKEEKKVADGTWYKFVLSGAATPGKALIMFNGAHGKHANRHPADGDVGIPLFDYPDREGWIDLTKKNPEFTSIDLTSSGPKKGEYTFRITWYYEYSNVYFTQINFTEGNVTGSFDGEVSSSDPNMRYYEFKSLVEDFDVRKWKFKKGSGGESGEYSGELSHFVWDPLTKSFNYEKNIGDR